MEVKQKEEKYLVLKLADIENYLSQRHKEFLNECCDEIRLARLMVGKKPNHYIVVNETEPYAETVWDLVLDREPTPPKDWKPYCFSDFDKDGKCDHDEYYMMASCDKCPFTK